jgi:ring-1,2-phenylacetyl-CoA epoxidase subunit PaaB
MSDSVLIKSLDPRVSRMNIPVDASVQNFEPTKELHHLQTFEVFHQAKSGARHIHVGSVHAPNAELAILFAKEQFGRRSQTVNMWVVKTEDVISLSPEDVELFTTTPDKDFREASGYKVMQKLNAFKKARKESEASGS